MSRTFSGRRLREARDLAGLRREMVALVANRSVHSIISYETGRAVPPTMVMVRLADVLGCSVDEFFVQVAADER